MQYQNKTTMEKKIVKKYKGIVLNENDFAGYLAGEGKYAVYCGTKKFVFNTIQNFKDAVNGHDALMGLLPVWIPFIENGEWDSVPLAEFKDFVLNNKVA